MKHTLLIITALMLIVGFSSGQEPIDEEKDKYTTNLWQINSSGFYEDQIFIGYDNNKNSFTYEIKDNIIYKGNKPYTGYLIIKYDNGDINLEGNFINGKKDGLIKSYYDNQQIYYEVNYKNGIKHGRRTMYYQNGIFQEEGNYIDGKEEGIWIIVDSLGYINKGNFENGKKEGLWGWYITDPETSLDTIQVEESFYKQGLLKGKTDFVIENNELMSKITNYYDNGRIKSQYNYIDGKLNGTFITYYDSENGEIELSDNYKDGKVYESIFYYKNGQKRTEQFYTYINEDQHYKWTRYYENGQIQEKGQWINGLENGEFIIYKNERIVEKHNWKDGEMNGQSTVYYENGNIKFSVIYKKGIIDKDSVIFYDENGEIIKVEKN